MSSIIMIKDTEFITIRQKYEYTQLFTTSYVYL